MQSGGEEEQDEEAHTPLPPPMEIIKDPSAQDEKVRGGTGERGKVSELVSLNVGHSESDGNLSLRLQCRLKIV